jgi:hypothetical protein
MSNATHNAANLLIKKDKKMIQVTKRGLTPVMSSHA